MPRTPVRVCSRHRSTLVQRTMLTSFLVGIGWHAPAADAGRRSGSYPSLGPHRRRPPPPFPPAVPPRCSRPRCCAQGMAWNPCKGWVLAGGVQLVSGSRPETGKRKRTADTSPARKSKLHAKQHNDDNVYEIEFFSGGRTRFLPHPAARCSNGVYGRVCPPPLPFYSRAHIPA